MSAATELEQWLRDQARTRIQQALARRSYARAGTNLTDVDRRVVHALAEQMSGRKLPKTSRADEAKSATIEEHIASKLEGEAAMLLRFAAFVCSIDAEGSKRLLIAASHALRSYQHGNSAPDLAKEIADKIDEATA